MKQIKMAVLLGAAVVYGCAYPSHTVDQGTAQGHLFFPGAWAGAVVTVDGRQFGEAAAYDGKEHFLDVAPGPHRVVIAADGRTVVDRDVYVGADARLAVRAQ